MLETRRQPRGSLLWLLPGLLCLVAAVPTGLVAIVIGSDEALAARPYQVAAGGLVLGGLGVASTRRWCRPTSR